MKNHYTYDQRDLPTAFCTDWNNVDGDGCTKCKIDPGYICRMENIRNGPDNFVFRYSQCNKCSLNNLTCLNANRVCGSNIMVWNSGLDCDHPYICDSGCRRYNNSNFREQKQEYNPVAGVTRQDIVFFYAAFRDYYSHTDIGLKYKAISKSVGIGFRNFT